MHDSVAMAWLGLGLIIAAAVAAALLLRAARCPGWAVVGGVCAGIVLGPTLLGRVMPSAFEQMYIGGRAQQRDLEAAQHYQQHALTGRAEPPLDAHQLDNLRAARDAACWKHQRPMRNTAMIVVALVLLGAATGPRGTPDPQQRAISAVTIGAWAALLPGGVAFVVLHLLLDIDLAPSLLTASAAAIGPWRLTDGDVEAADRAELGGARLLHRAGIVAAVIAIVIAGYAVWQLRGASGLLYVLPLVALAMSWIAPRIESRQIDSLLHVILIPSMAALATISVELFIHFALWPLLLFILLSGDGRWLGSWLGAMLLGGRKGLRTMRLMIGVMACGPTQLAFAVIAAHGDLLDESLVMAIIAGAVLLEILTPARRRLARHIARTEQELEQLMDD